MAINQKIHFVTGKGGVGKSTFAAALAQKLAAKSQKVLLVELGDASYFQECMQGTQIQHQPTRVSQGFEVAIWNGESCLREYVLHFLKLEKLLSLFFENSVMRALINVAPGLSEISILGKITSGIRHVGPALEYEHIVVDAYSSGHFMAFIRAPKGMKEAIGVGPMGKHSSDMLDVLCNPNICSYYIVSLLEEMPCTESLELKLEIEKLLKIEPQLIANKLIEPPLNEQELQKVQSTSDNLPLKTFCDFLTGTLKRQDYFLDKLQKQSTQKIKKLNLVFTNNPQELIQKCVEQECLRNL